MKDFDLLKPLQTLLGFVVFFYLLKGVLGKFRQGDLTKGVIVLLVWLVIAGFNSGLLKLAGY
jgi:uncharacterized membrane-anchored protein